MPKDKLGTVSDMEAQLKRDWVEIVAAQFKKEFGKEIDPSYLPAFEAHGLHFSRYNKGELKGELRPVKDRKIPFDLLREVSAAEQNCHAHGF